MYVATLKILTSWHPGLKTGARLASTCSIPSLCHVTSSPVARQSRRLSGEGAAWTGVSNSATVDVLHSLRGGAQINIETLKDSTPHKQIAQCVHVRTIFPRVVVWVRYCQSLFRSGLESHAPEEDMIVSHSLAYRDRRANRVPYSVFKEQSHDK